MKLTKEQTAIIECLPFIDEEQTWGAAVDDIAFDTGIPSPEVRTTLASLRKQLEQEKGFECICSVSNPKKKVGQQREYGLTHLGMRLISYDKARDKYCFNL